MIRTMSQQRIKEVTQFLKVSHRILYISIKYYANNTNYYINKSNWTKKQVCIFFKSDFLFCVNDMNKRTIIILTQLVIR
jgi:hypothetical protein